MSWLTVELGDMWRASATCDLAAETADETPVAKVEDLVATALPGSRSAMVASVLAEVWESQLATWSQDVGRYASGLRLLGGDYGTADGDAAAALRTCEPGQAELR